MEEQVICTSKGKKIPNWWGTTRYPESVDEGQVDCEERETIRH